MNALQNLVDYGVIGGHLPRDGPKEPVRHCLRDEAKEGRPDARPQTQKTGGVFAGIH